MLITLGADPEIVVADKNGLVVPAWTITKGLKRGEKEMINGTVSVHADGVALEFNFNPVPAPDFSQTALAAYRDVVAWVNNKGHQVYTKPSLAGWSKEALMHPLATETGCSEDFCAYNENPRQARTPPKLEGEETRHFGGHIHIGYDKGLVPSHALIRLVDAFVYLPVAYYDRQTNRRAYYGLPGLFREKDYGVEYRTPSNFWLVSRGMAACMQRNLIELFSALEDRVGEVHTFYREVDWPALQSVLTSPAAGNMGGWWNDVGSPFCKRIDMEIETYIG